ncbi:MAG: hypothetical protein LBT09_08420 [Planctomycetaceae bacterium]|jgi:hypothetical protein|nr:hypothetical protein [Planctomycetaceae bacterium]
MTSEILPRKKPVKPVEAYAANNIGFIIAAFLLIFVFRPYAFTIDKYIPALYNVGLYKTVVNNVYVTHVYATVGTCSYPKPIFSNGDKVRFNSGLDFLLRVALVLFPCGFVCALLHLFIDNYICKDFDEKVRKYEKDCKVWETGECPDNNLSSPNTEKNEIPDSSDGNIVYKFVIFILSRLGEVTFLKIPCLLWIVIFFILVAIILELSQYISGIFKTGL